MGTAHPTRGSHVGTLVRFRRTLGTAIFQLAEGVDAETFVLGGGRFLDDVAADEADLFIDVFRDDVVPVGEAGVELGIRGARPFLAVAIGFELPLVFLLDSLALGLLRIDDRRPRLSGFFTGFGFVFFLPLGSFFFLRRLGTGRLGLKLAAGLRIGRSELAWRRTDSG